MDERHRSNRQSPAGGNPAGDPADRSPTRSRPANSRPAKNPPAADRGLWDTVLAGAAPGLVGEAERRRHTACVTPEGAAWLASASDFPRGVEALWSARPASPSVLPCGRAFDVVNLPALFGRLVQEWLWAAGPGSGPVAVHRGRVLLLVAPGTAQRLPSLLGWEEWAGAMPPILCHGAGDAVTVPPLYGQAPETALSRWVVAPNTRHPWLPDAGVLLWACFRAVRPAPAEEAPSLVSAPGTA